jgi:hypothetical protein
MQVPASMVNTFWFGKKQKAPTEAINLSAPSVKGDLYKFFIGIIGGISIIATGIPIYNYYILPVIRHKEILDKIDGFDKRLKKLEK